MRTLTLLTAQRMAHRAWRRTLTLGALLSALSVSSASAQDALGTCQDQLRGVRVYAERLTKEKQGGDLDAAQTIANLIKQIESLQAEVQRMKASEKPAGSGQPAAGSVPPKEGK